MFSRRNFSWKRWLTLAAFLFSITFFLAYFTGWTHESKQFLKSNSSLIRRAVTALAVGLVISFINNDPKK
jgi:amino acid permease